MRSLETLRQRLCLRRLSAPSQMWLWQNSRLDPTSTRIGVEVDFLHASRRGQEMQPHPPLFTQAACFETGTDPLLASRNTSEGSTL
eukprot:m.428721 g.428721  ORF g.428721 m.428721 type:complete len:86 (-) comp16871_c1_seq6:158-415(-)